MTFVESPQQRTQRVNSTAIAADDTAVRLCSLRNLNCSLVAGGADDPSHLVRAPNAQPGHELLRRARHRLCEHNAEKTQVRLRIEIEQHIGQRTRVSQRAHGSNSAIARRDRLDQLPDVLPLRWVVNAVVRPGQLEPLV